MESAQSRIGGELLDNQKEDSSSRVNPASNLHSLGEDTFSNSRTAAQPSEEKQALVDRLVKQATEGNEESDNENFLSATDGEENDSDDDKIQEWGERLINSESNAQDSFLNDVPGSSNGPTPCASVECNSCDTIAQDRGDGYASEATVAAGGDGEDEEAVEDDGGGDHDDKLKEEKEKERRRAEEEALTEEERERRLKEAMKIKTDGNAAFKEGEFSRALDLYTQALVLCPLHFQHQRAIMFSNRAACRVKEEDYEGVVADCSAAVELEPSYVKALNRRAEAYQRLEKLEDALKDHQKILEVDRSQAASYHASMRLEHEIKERNEKMKAEMMDKLKDLGNMVLRPFGLSTNNFNLQQDPNTGSYSVQFVQGQNNGK